MGTSHTVAEFSAKIKRAGTAIEKARADELKLLGSRFKMIADAHVVADIHGDHFRRWKPALTSKATPVGTAGLRFGPSGSGAGPWRVAEQGRHAGMAGPMQGPTITRSKKSGKRSVSRARRKRWNGTTKGKGTWTKTTEELAQVTPPRLHSAFIRALNEVF